MATIGWTQTCRAERLRLRAACNEALEPAQRPIRPRVVERLCASTEAADLYAELALGGEEPVRVFAALMADPRWRTLVAEHVHQEQRWTDLWDGAFATIWDWLGALFQKPTGKEHPVARAVTILLMGACTVGVTLKATKVVELPIRAVFDQGAKLQVEASVATGQTKIPVVLEAAPAKLPVQISAEASGPVLQSLADIAGEARLGNQRLKTATDRMQALVVELRGTNARLAGGPDASVASGLKTLSESLGTVRGSVEAGLETARALSASVQTIDGKLADQKRDTRELTEHARDWQTSTRVVTLTAGNSEFVPLWLPNDTNGGAGCNGEVKLVRLEKREARLSVTPHGCPATPEEPLELKLEKGKSEPLPTLRLMVTVTGVDRRWFGQDVVSVRLSSTGRAQASN